MITTLTLNPCIDKTVIVPNFRMGEMNRISSTKSVYAGKGFNVSKGIAKLGHKTLITGFLYSEDSDNAIRSITDEGEGNIQFDCVTCPGHLRVNIKVFDETTRTVTELNEPGVPSNDQFNHSIITKVNELSKKSKFLILSGSIPPNCPSDIYLQIIQTVKQSSNECSIILDANGNALKSVFCNPLNKTCFMPDIIKPNKEEFSVIVQRELSSNEEIKIEAVRLINEFGIKIICVSLGADGAIITNGKESFFAPPVKDIVVKGTVCAGDSMIAGLVTGLVENLSLKEAFRKAVAAGTACVMQGSSAVVSKELLIEVLERVIIYDI